jgi:hypothetical protein
LREEDNRSKENCSETNKSQRSPGHSKSIREAFS